MKQSYINILNVPSPPPRHFFTQIIKWDSALLSENFTSFKSSNRRTFKFIDCQRKPTAKLIAKCREKTSNMTNTASYSKIFSRFACTEPFHHQSAAQIETPTQNSINYGVTELKKHQRPKWKKCQHSPTERKKIRKINNFEYSARRWSMLAINNSLKNN